MCGKPSSLVFGPFTIWNRTGTQQGDPLGMLLFALVLQPLLLEIQDHFALPLLAFYADDGTILVPRSIASAVLSFTELRGGPRVFSSTAPRPMLGGLGLLWGLTLFRAFNALSTRLVLSASSVLRLVIMTGVCPFSLIAASLMSVFFTRFANYKTLNSLTTY